MTNEQARAAAIEAAEFEVQRLRIREELRRSGTPWWELDEVSYGVTVIERYSLPSCAGRIGERMRPYFPIADEEDA